MKYVFVSYVPLTEHIAQSFYLDDLSREGIDVRYWDLSALFFPGIPFTNLVERPYIEKITGFSALRDRIAAHEGQRSLVYVLQVTYELKTMRLFRMFSRTSVPVWFFARGCLPSARRTGGEFLRKLLSPAALCKHLQRLVFRLVSRACRLPRFDTVLYAGSAARPSYPVPSALVPINSFDFDRAAAVRVVSPSLPAGTGRFAVFLDDNIVHDSDFAVIGVSHIDPAPYYNALNAFFLAIERAFRLTVVIAAHPKSTYAANPFDGRRIEIGRTAELVRDAACCIAHYSTSCAYAVIFRKPVYFAFTDEIARMPYMPIIRAFAHELHMPLINMSARVQLQESFPSVDRSGYERFTYAYLTSPEAERETTLRIILRTLAARGGISRA